MLLKPCAFTWSSRASVIRGLPHDVSSLPVESSVLPTFQPGCIAATSAIASELALPVHRTPFSSNDDGTGLDPVQVPVNPKETFAFVPILAL